MVAAPLGLLLLLLRPGRREALVAALLLGFTVWGLVNTEPGFDRAAAAYVCLFAGGTAVALTVWPPGRRPVMTMIFAAIGLAATAAVLLVGVTSFSWGELRWLAEHKFGANVRLLMGILAQQAQQAPSADVLSANMEESAADLVKMIGMLLPGLVLLQSLAALAAAWALYRKLARHPEGEPLPKLREFRFNDQLVWGIVLALIALVIPGGERVRELGGNLAAFFGGLYVLRGVAVFAGLASAAGVGVLTLVLLMMMVAVLLPLALFTALAIGVTDTWVDWRKKLTTRPSV